MKVGDQLVAVNGNSTYKMKIDETRGVINSSSNPKEIELTFVRYVGPLRGAQIKDSNIMTLTKNEIKTNNGLVSGGVHSSTRNAHHVKAIIPPPPPRVHDESSIVSNDDEVPDKEVKQLYDTTSLEEDSNSNTSGVHEIDEIPNADMMLKKDDLCEDSLLTNNEEVEKVKKPIPNALLDEEKILTGPIERKEVQKDMEDEIEVKEEKKKKKILNLFTRFKKKK